MSRLITIGCSLTEYVYPTWADMVGTHFDEYYNLGNAGSGHAFMHVIFNEADTILNLGEGDTVMLMSTSFTRYDVWLPHDGKLGNWGWQGNGNVWQEGKFPKDFFKHLYSNAYCLMQSYASLKSIKEICEAKGIKFYLLKGFDTNKFYQDNEGPHSKDIYEDVQLDFYIDALDNLFEIEKKSLYTYLEEQPFFPGYSYEDTDVVDAHPTITMHNQYLKSVLPQYAITDDYIKDLESNMVLTSQEENRKVEAFNKLRGKRLGSLISKQLSNDCFYNFKHSF